jgi:hypothetical protein
MLIGLRAGLIVYGLYLVWRLMRLRRVEIVDEFHTFLHHDI